MCAAWRLQARLDGFRRRGIGTHLVCRAGRGRKWHLRRTAVRGPFRTSKCGGNVFGVCVAVVSGGWGMGTGADALASVGVGSGRKGGNRSGGVRTLSGGSIRESLAAACGCAGSTDRWCAGEEEGGEEEESWVYSPDCAVYFGL